MTRENIIATTVDFVKETLRDAEGGHDWWHLERVWKNTKTILANEPTADKLVCELAALLHDIADSKFHQGDESIGPSIASTFLSEKLFLDESTKNHIVAIIRNMSFSKSLEKHVDKPFSSLELKIIQDADRLDAIGAIGIARAFNFGGFKNRPFYDPQISPKKNLTKEIYKKRQSPTINHFYEKLLLLKDLMHTDTAKKIAESRHQYTVEFLNQFFKEWNSEDLNV